MNNHNQNSNPSFLKRKLHWIFLALALLFLAISIFSLRANNQKMIELRAEVFAADEQDGDVEAALKNLREYVYSHMNTDLASGENSIKPPIQLKYRYERLVEAERAESQTGTTGNLYIDAQNYCEANQPSGFSGSNRLACIREYLDNNGVSQDVSQIVIPDSLYKFDFVSPSWSADLAGWSIVLSAIFFFLFLVRVIGELVVHRRLIGLN